MKLLAKHMMESVSGAGNQDNIDNIKFINDLVLTAAIGASMTPAAPVVGAGTAVVGSLIHDGIKQLPVNVPIPVLVNPTQITPEQMEMYRNYFNSQH